MQFETYVFIRIHTVTIETAVNFLIRCSFKHPNTLTTETFHVVTVTGMNVRVNV